MSLLETENIKIQNDTQLAYYEHMLEYLASEEVSGLSDWRDILSIMTLMIAVGAMLGSFVQLINEQNLGAILMVVTMLLGSVGYAWYAQLDINKSKRNLPLVKEKVINAIECYKKSKGESK
jgi:hypothetical protein